MIILKHLNLYMNETVEDKTETQMMTIASENKANSRFDAWIKAILGTMKAYLEPARQIEPAENTFIYTSDRWPVVTDVFTIGDYMVVIASQRLPDSIALYDFPKTDEFKHAAREVLKLNPVRRNIIEEVG
jgi:hypothetical protein